MAKLSSYCIMTTSMMMMIGMYVSNVAVEGSGEITTGNKVIRGKVLTNSPFRLRKTPSPIVCITHGCSPDELRDLGWDVTDPEGFCNDKEGCRGCNTVTEKCNYQAEDEYGNVVVDWYAINDNDYNMPTQILMQLTERIPVEAYGYEPILVRGIPAPKGFYWVCGRMDPYVFECTSYAGCNDSDDTGFCTYVDDVFTELTSYPNDNYMDLPPIISYPDDSDDNDMDLPSIIDSNNYP